MQRRYINRLLLAGLFFMLPLCVGNAYAAKSSLSVRGLQQLVLGKSVSAAEKWLDQLPPDQLAAAINKPDEFSNTLLIRVVRNMDLTTAQKIKYIHWLFAKGAKQYIPPVDDNTSIIIATERGYLGILNILLQQAKKSMTPEEYQKLINHRGEGERTALVNAINTQEDNYDQLVNALIKAGADVNVQDKNGRTALMAAAQYPSLESLKLMVSDGGNIQHVSKYGDTLLSAGLRSCDAGVVQYVLSQSTADINKADSGGRAPLLSVLSNITCKNWNNTSTGVDVVKTLVANGACVNASYVNRDDKAIDAQSLISYRSAKLRAEVDKILATGEKC